jgi:hypothetical protein
MSLQNASWMPWFTFMTMKLEKNTTHKCGFLYIPGQILNQMTLCLTQNSRALPSIFVLTLNDLVYTANG